MTTCTHCNKTSNEEKCMINEPKILKKCKKYNSDIFFTCKFCGWFSSLLTDVDNHLESCKSNKFTNPISILNNQISQLTQENTLLKSKIIKYEKNVKTIKKNHNTTSQIQQLKISVLSNIIETQTDIDPYKIFEYKDDGIYVYDNSKMDNIPVIYNNTQKSKPDKIVMKKDKKNITTKKEIFRTIRKIKNEPDNPNVINQQIQTIDDKLHKIKYENFDVSHKDITETITEIFILIKNSRIYTKHLQEMKGLRSRLLGKLNIKEYTELIKEHINVLTLIFVDKGYDNKKTIKIISSCLSSLDKRLILYGDYVDTLIEQEDIDKFKLAIQITTPSSKQYVKFNLQSTIDNILNYSVALFTIKDCLDMFFFNCYGFNNLIYLEKENSVKDYFTFYSLDKVQECNKYWKMECRLEEICNNIITSLKSQCITLFRMIYLNIFNDNIYRKDYKNKSQITEYDGEQLIQNILTLSHPAEFNRMFRSLVKSKATYKPTIYDKFNLTSDDKLQQKRMKELKDNEDDIIKTLMLVFDNLSWEQGRDFLSNVY